jgi:hypothetical protein
MNAWKPLTAEQKQVLGQLEEQKRIVAALYERKAEAEQELTGLLKQSEKSKEDLAQIRSLRDELSKLDPVQYPPKTWPGKGKEPPGRIQEAELKLAGRERDAARSQLSLYDRIRAATPSDSARERALSGVTTDQIGPLKTQATALQADHIISVREVSEMEGFADLPWADQKAIVDMKENLIAMDGAANASKGDRSWSIWSQASNYYDASTIQKMVKREADVRAMVEAEIKRRVAALGATTP